MIGDWSNPTYIISQMFIVIGFTFFGITYFAKNRTKQLWNIIACNIFVGIGYMLLGAYIAVCMSAIGIVRDSTSAIINKYQLSQNTRTSYFLLALWLILPSIAAIFTYDGWHSLLAYIATVIFVVSIWQKNQFIYRLMGIPMLILWTIYQIVIANVAGIFFESAILISAIIGLISYIKSNKS